MPIWKGEGGGKRALVAFEERESKDGSKPEMAFKMKRKRVSHLMFEKEEEGFVWRLSGLILSNVDAQSQKKRMKDEDIFVVRKRYFLM
jgi:hypothetical protein